MDRGNADCRVYVGNLPSDVKAKELDDLFYKYGNIKDISLKKDTRGGQPFAFIEFEDPRYFMNIVLTFIVEATLKKIPFIAKCTILILLIPLFFLTSIQLFQIFFADGLQFSILLLMLQGCTRCNTRS
jgi:hypothetical protein